MGVSEFRVLRFRVWLLRGIGIRVSCMAEDCPVSLKRALYRLSTVLQNRGLGGRVPPGAGSALFSVQASHLLRLFAERVHGKQGVVEVCQGRSIRVSHSLDCCRKMWELFDGDCKLPLFGSYYRPQHRGTFCSVLDPSFLVRRLPWVAAGCPNLSPRSSVGGPTNPKPKTPKP